MDKNARSVAQSVLRTVWPSHVLSSRCRSAVRAGRSAQKDTLALKLGPSYVSYPVIRRCRANTCMSAEADAAGCACQRRPSHQDDYPRAEVMLLGGGVRRTCGMGLRISYRGIDLLDHSGAIIGRGCSTSISARIATHKRIHTTRSRSV